MALYQLGILGDTRRPIVRSVTRTVRELTQPFGILGEIEVVASLDEFAPVHDYASAALFFASERESVDEEQLVALMRQGTAIVPIISDGAAAESALPQCLWPINALYLDAEDTSLTRPVTAALEVLGLLPRQRRIFLSYRRSESREAALQLFDYLSGRHFDVFLDTHGVPPGADFQAVLWHRLSDSDVLVMLDTASYFEGRWTRQEFGRALAKSLVPLRLGWPGVKPAPRSLSSDSIQFTQADFSDNGNTLTDEALIRAAFAIERSRSRGVALRTAELNGAVIHAVNKIDGRFLGFGPKRTVAIELDSGRKILIHSSIGVPTAEHLYEAARATESGVIPVVAFDDAGIERYWQDHLDWLGEQVRGARFLRKAHAALQLASWDYA